MDLVENNDLLLLYFFSFEKEMNNNVERSDFL